MFDFPNTPALNDVFNVVGRDYVWNGTGWLISPFVAKTHGQCILGLEGANIVLRPYNGNKLLINDKAETVPDGGVVLLPGGTINTINYIYAFMTGGTMTLEISTTSHARSSATGVQIRTGSPTRTLVGMAYPVTGPAFVVSSQRALVRSWFNDPGAFVRATLSVQVSTTSGVMVQIHTDYWVHLLLWRGETWLAKHSGGVSSTGSCFTQIMVNAVGAAAASQTTSAYWLPFGQIIPNGTPATTEVSALVAPYGLAAAGASYWYAGCGLSAIARGRA